MAPPYLAPLAFYRSVAKGERPASVAINRARLTPGLLLTVPIVGGSGAIKRLKPEQLEISQHGRWQHTHLGALEAQLGRTPFWRHLEPDITPLIATASGRFLDLTEALNEALIRFLDLENLLPELRQLARTSPERLERLADRYLRDADPDVPLLIQAALHGRNAIFTLASPLLQKI